MPTPFATGDTVTPAPGPTRYGTREATQAEREAWYAAHLAEAPHDSAGEPWAFSGQTLVVLVPGTRYTIIRPRVTARVGWLYRPGYCQVTGPDGVSLKVAPASLVPCPR